MLDGYTYTLSGELETLTGSIDEIKTSPSEVEEIIEDFQKKAAASQDHLMVIRQNMIRWIYEFSVCGIVFLVWPVVSLSARFLQGLKLLLREG